jgi:RND family efflux transporter MFP subunit
MAGVNRVFHLQCALAMLLAAAPVAAIAQDPAPVDCLIEPDQIVKLSTPVAGIVAEVLVDRGDVVRAGQVVARLDTAAEAIAVELARLKAEDETGVNAARARLAFLEEQARRKERLAKSLAVSDSDAKEAAMQAETARQELAQEQLKRDQARLEGQQAQVLMDQKTLKSPVDGVVTERLLNPGEFRDTQSHILTIAKLDVLNVEAFLPIAYIASVAVGDRVEVLPEPPLDRPREAIVTVIDRVFDAATATFGVRMQIDNRDLSLPGGLRCQVRFDPPAIAALPEGEGGSP